jgi:protein TonB
LAGLTSVTIHAAIAVALLTLHFTGADQTLARRFQSVAIVAPNVRPTPVIRMRPKVPALVSPREFHATLHAPAPPHERIIIEAPAAPIAIEAAPQVPVTPLPATAPIIEPKVAVKAAGFTAAETSSSGPPRGSLLATGAFNTEGAGESAPARGKVTQVGGFGASGAAPSQSRARTLANAAFGDTTIAAGNAPARKAAGPAAFQPVEILSKPRPQYTDEARRKQIEGEVLLEILFGAAGEARVVRVVRGLGYGLDETAIAAAREIRFKPAQREGAAVDSAAVVHIVFQLAF